MPKVLGLLGEGGRKIFPMKSLAIICYTDDLSNPTSPPNPMKMNCPKSDVITSALRKDCQDWAGRVAFERRVESDKRF